MWFLNSYSCPDCDEHWEDEWDCQCDDECPECGKPYEPRHCIELALKALKKETDDGLQ